MHSMQHTVQHTVQQRVFFHFNFTVIKNTGVTVALVTVGAARVYISSSIMIGAIVPEV